MTFSVNNDDRLWREQQQRNWFHGASLVRFMLLLVVIICLIVGVWYVFFSSPAPQTKGEIPLIRMDESPFKVKAKDQGVPGIEHQDKLIYGRIRNDQTPPAVEHILPEPEPIKMIEQYVPEDVELEKSVEEKPETKTEPVSPETKDSAFSIEALIDAASDQKKD